MLKRRPPTLPAFIRRQRARRLERYVGRDVTFTVIKRRWHPMRFYVEHSR